LLIVGCALLISSCDLFNAPKQPDYLSKIDADIAWANAAKITVTVAYPPEWGVSPQRGTGSCGDTRVGYPFDVEFDPYAEYALLRWEAYATQSLPGNWLTVSDPEAVLLSKARKIDNPSLPIMSQSGGSGKVTLYSSEDVTLIPFSREQPRVVQSVPDATMEKQWSKSSIVPDTGSMGKVPCCNCSSIRRQPA